MITLKDIDKKLRLLEKKLNVIFVDKAPSLPKWFIRFTVWLTPFFVLLGIFAYIFAICLIFISSTVEFSTWLNTITYIAWTAFFIYAFKYINGYTKKGWKLLYYSTLIGEIIAVILLIGNFTIGLLINDFIWALISFYVLFQIRTSFNK